MNNNIYLANVLARVFYFLLEGEEMKPNDKQQLKKKGKKKENLSTREIEELMGVNRDTYTRKNGAIRRK
jgi:hypothetical protein